MEMEYDEDSKDDIIVHPDDPVPWFPEQDPQDQENGDKPARLKRRKRCGQCGPCQIKTNCMQCCYCLRRSVLKQSCIYRKCIYLRKPVSSNVRKSPSKEERVYKRQMLLAAQVSNNYPPELLSPDGDLDSSYELMSPPEFNGYSIDSLPDDQDITYLEYPEQSIIIEPVFGQDENPDDDVVSLPGTPKPKLADKFEIHGSDPEEECDSVHGDTPHTRNICTPPHPMEQNAEVEDFVNPQLINALKTAEDNVHNVIQKPTEPAETLTPPSLMTMLEMSASVESKRRDLNRDRLISTSQERVSPLKFPQLLEDIASVRVPTASPTSTSTENPTAAKAISFPQIQPFNTSTDYFYKALKAYPTPAVEFRQSSLFPSSNSPIDPKSLTSHSIHSISSTYTSKHKQFFSPPNVTVGRMGGFTPTHRLDPTGRGDGHLHPLNLSGLSVNPNVSPYPQFKDAPKNPTGTRPTTPPWPHGFSSYPAHSYPRMMYPPNVYTPPYPHLMGHYEYPPGYLPYLPVYAPARMEGYGKYQPNSLFPPDKYPVPPSMYPDGYYAPAYQHPNVMYRSAPPQTASQPENYSKHLEFRKHPDSSQAHGQTEAEVSENEKEEMEEYKKYSIFRLQLKSEEQKSPTPKTTDVEESEKENDKTRDSVFFNQKEQEKEQLSEIDLRNESVPQMLSESAKENEPVKPVVQVPPLRNETLRQLLNFNMNNAGKAKNSTTSTSSIIDDDLRKEMNKVSGYCSSNIITIDDLKMEAVIRSDGVNNLEIEIPSPNGNKKDSTNVSSDSSSVNLNRAKTADKDSASITKNVPFMKDPEYQKDLASSQPKPVAVKGTVCLKQILGDEGILILEVQSEKVVLVQCVLDNELLRQSANPKELKEYLTKSQPKPQYITPSETCSSAVEVPIINVSSSFSANHISDPRSEASLSNQRQLSDESILITSNAAINTAEHIPKFSGQLNIPKPYTLSSCPGLAPANSKTNSSDAFHSTNMLSQTDHWKQSCINLFNYSQYPPINVLNKPYSNVQMGPVPMNHHRNVLANTIDSDPKQSLASNHLDKSRETLLRNALNLPLCDVSRLLTADPNIMNTAANVAPIVFDNVARVPDEAKRYVLKRYASDNQTNVPKRPKTMDSVPVNNTYIENSTRKSIAIIDRLSNFIDTTIKSYDDFTELSDNEPMSDSTVMGRDYYPETQESNKNSKTSKKNSNTPLNIDSDNFKITSNTDSFYCESESKSDSDEESETMDNSLTKCVLHDFQIMSNTESVNCESFITESEKCASVWSVSDKTLSNSASTIVGSNNQNNIIVKESENCVIGDSPENNNISESMLTSVEHCVTNVPSNSNVATGDSKQCTSECNNVITRSSHSESNGACEKSDKKHNDKVWCSSKLERQEKGCFDSTYVDKQDKQTIDFGFSISSVCSLSQDNANSTSSSNTPYPLQNTSSIGLFNSETSSSNSVTCTSFFTADNTVYPPCVKLISDVCPDQSSSPSTDFFMNGLEFKSKSANVTICNNIDEIFQSSSHRAVTDDSPVGV